METQPPLSSPGPQGPLPTSNPSDFEAKPPAQPQVPWGAGDIAWAILSVLLAFPLLVIGGRALTPIGLSGATLLITFALESLLVGVVWRFALYRYQLRWRDLGFRDLVLGGGLKYSALGIVGSVAVVAAYGALLRALGLEDRIPPIPIFRESQPFLLVSGVALASLGAPLAEEVFFRGFVFSGMRKTIGPWAAAIFSSVLFAVAHMSPFLYPPVFVIGLIFSWVYTKSGSLWYNILAHVGYNSLVAYVALSTR